MRVHFNANYTKALGSEDDFDGTDDFKEAAEDEYEKLTGSSCVLSNFDLDEYVIPKKEEVGRMTKVDDMAPEYYYAADVEEARE